MHKVTLANEVEFICDEHQTILEAAIANDIALEHSCKTGRCGVCVAPVIEGETQAIKNEESPQTRDIASDDILTCCRSPRSDIRLDVSDLGEIGRLKVRTLPCRVESVVRLNDEVMKLTFRLPPSGNFIFFPGQYLDLINGSVRRSYSIANAPRDDGRIELQVKYQENGLMSEILFCQAKQDDLFRLEGPLGTFSYRDDGEKNVILMATGTGIAPIKALLEGFRDVFQSKRVFVVWGGRFRKDLYFDIQELGSEIEYVPVLSRENVHDFFFGYVQDAALQLGVELHESSVYACGSEVMIRDARECLLINGLPEKRFHSDAFVCSS